MPLKSRCGACFTEQECCILCTHWHSNKAGATWKEWALLHVAQDQKKWYGFIQTAIPLWILKPNPVRVPLLPSRILSPWLHFLCFWGRGALRSVMGLDDPDEPPLRSPLTPSARSLRGSIWAQAWGFNLSHAGKSWLCSGCAVFSHGPPGSALPLVGWYPTLNLPEDFCAPSLHGNHHQTWSRLVLPAWFWTCRSAWSCLMTRTAGGTWLPSLGCPALLPQEAGCCWMWCLPWLGWLCLAPYSLGSSWDLLLGDILLGDILGWRAENQSLKTHSAPEAVLQPSGEEMECLTFLMISLHIQKWGYFNKFICGLGRLTC